MRRPLVFAALVIVFAGVLSVFYFIIVNIKSVQVGVFYYVWYNPAESENWNRTKIVDEPLLGFYNSCESWVIRQHLRWMEELRIDFLIVSWWGFYDNYGRFTDNATRQIFETVRAVESNLKVAIMVEPFNRTGHQYDHSEIYNHIYDQFVNAYPSIYYKIEGKPLICFFNNEFLTPNGEVPPDTRFKRIKVGHEDYVEWIYTDLNYHVKPRNIPHSNQISVTPRFDDSSFRSPSCIVDQDLSQGIYDKEWGNATRLFRDGKISIIVISSWNEYPERTAIEPHFDKTAYNHDPYFLFNKTEYYIDQLKN